MTWDTNGGKWILQRVYNGCNLCLLDWDGFSRIRDEKSKNTKIWKRTWIEGAAWQEVSRVSPRWEGDAWQGAAEPEGDVRARGRGNLRALRLERELGNERWQWWWWRLVTGDGGVERRQWWKWARERRRGRGKSRGLGTDWFCKRRGCLIFV